MAALISVVHKLNYAPSSRESISLIVARGHMHVMSSYRFVLVVATTRITTGNGHFPIVAQNVPLNILLDDFTIVTMESWHVIEL